MGDDDDRHAGFAARILQQLQNCLTGLVVQCAGGFIAQQQLRILRQRAGNGHTLLLTAGQLTGEILAAGLQTHVAQHFFRVQRLFANLICQLHVFQCRQITDQIIKLEHKAHIVTAIFRQLFFVQAGNFTAIQQDLAGAEGIHTAQNIQQCGFTGTGRADNDHQFALFNFKIHIVQRVDLHFACPIVFSDIMKLNKCQDIPLLF